MNAPLSLWRTVRASAPPLEPPAHALRLIRQEREVLMETYRQVLADRSIEDRPRMLAELSREVRELSSAERTLKHLPQDREPRERDPRRISDRLAELAEDKRALASLDRDWKRGRGG